MGDLTRRLATWPGAGVGLAAGTWPATGLTAGTGLAAGPRPVAGPGMRTVSLSPFLLSVENGNRLARQGRDLGGFGLFSPTHLFFLLVLATLGVLLVRAYRRTGEPGRRRQRLVMAGLILFLELGKDVFLWATGQFQYANWPLELCGLAVFIIGWDAIAPNQFTRALLYSLALPGAVFAVLTPNWVSLPAVNVMVWQAFLIHGLIASYILQLLVSRELVPQAEQLWRSVLFLAVFGGLDFWLNQRWGTNFMFLGTPVPGSPLQPVAILFGPLYILGLVVLVAVFWLLMYTPWELVRWLARRREAQGREAQRR